VPEPATVSLFGICGLSSYLLRIRRRRKMRPAAGDRFEPVTYHRPFLAEERAAVPLGFDGHRHRF
jgi:hypothetical protein